MARTLNPKLRALRRDRIRRQAASGLSIEQFCAQEGLATNLECCRRAGGMAQGRFGVRSVSDERMKPESAGA
jgi:hypothetical protein